MPVLALYNMKGGVGKTTACVNLAYCAAADGFRTLVWDLDPQGAAGISLSVDVPDQDGKIKSLFKHPDRLDDMVTSTAWERLDVIPALSGFRHMDVLLRDGKKASKRLGNALDHFRECYDLVFLDCPAGMSMLSEGLFSQVDHLLMPLLPTEFSRRAYEQVKESLLHNKHATADMVAFHSMVDRRKRLHRLAVLKRFAEDPEVFCEASIPSRSDVERMPLERCPVAEYAPHSDAVVAYAALWREIVSRVALKPPHI